MPNIDDLTMDFHSALWMCSFDACSGFWSVGVTKRASEISAFICPLGHFQWLRMPQGLKNAPQIYQRMVDNALWGFLQPVSGWSSCQDLEKRAIQGYDENLVEVDIFAVGIPETSHITPVLLRRSYIDDIAFFGFDWSDMCQTCDLF